jgi:hypothetical protein
VFFKTLIQCLVKIQEASANQQGSEEFPTVGEASDSLSSSSSSHRAPALAGASVASRIKEAHCSEAPNKIPASEEERHQALGKQPKDSEDKLPLLEEQVLGSVDSRAPVFLVSEAITMLVAVDSSQINKSPLVDFLVSNQLKALLAFHSGSNQINPKDLLVRPLNNPLAYLEEIHRSL